MLKKMKFRQKIVLSQILLFLFFILISLPFINRSVDKVFATSLNASAKEIVEKIKDSSSEDKMISFLKQTKGDVFYNLALFNSEGHLLYDSDIDLLPSQQQEHLQETTPVEV